LVFRVRVFGGDSSQPFGPVPILDGVIHHGLCETLIWSLALSIIQKESPPRTLLRDGQVVSAYEPPGRQHRWVRALRLA
jgi:hypothetical protein